MKFLKVCSGDGVIAYIDIDSIVCLQVYDYEKGTSIVLKNGGFSTNETAEELIKKINELEKQK